VFVNHNGNMYIADFQNHRIMKWFSGAFSGIVAAGNGAAGISSTQLNLPTQVIVDTNEYMYISEGGNSRITRWAPNSTFGVCIAACTRAAGTASTQLDWPHSLAFDSNGSLYASDRNNNRVQKFQILPYAGAYVINLLLITIKSIIFDQIYARTNRLWSVSFDSIHKK
jgi:sugar lactone lactonase YvrE